MRAARWGLAMVMLATAVVAGCQSGDTVLTQAEYVEQGNAICTSMNESIMAAAMEQGGEGPPSGPEGEALFQTIMTNSEGAMDDLDALAGPDDMNAEMDAILAEARTIKTAVEAEGAEPFFASADDPWEAINPRFEAMGLSACAEGGPE